MKVLSQTENAQHGAVAHDDRESRAVIDPNSSFSFVVWKPGPSASLSEAEFSRTRSSLKGCLPHLSRTSQRDPQEKYGGSFYRAPVFVNRKRVPESCTIVPCTSFLESHQASGVSLRNTVILTGLCPSSRRH